MPQLDIIIIFPQIFWLFITFIFSYVMLTHFFLPCFIKSIKSRNLIILSNKKMLQIVEDKTMLNKKTSIDFISKSFFNIRIEFINNIVNLMQKKLCKDFSSLDQKLIIFTYYNVLYHHRLILSKVFLYPRLISL